MDLYNTVNSTFLLGRGWLIRAKTVGFILSSGLVCRPKRTHLIFYLILGKFCGIDFLVMSKIAAPV